MAGCGRTPSCGWLQESKTLLNRNQEDISKILGRYKQDDPEQLLCSMSKRDTIQRDELKALFDDVRNQLHKLEMASLSHFDEHANIFRDHKGRSDARQNVRGLQTNDSGIDSITMKMLEPTSESVENIAELGDAFQTRLKTVEDILNTDDSDVSEKYHDEKNEKDDSSAA